MKLLSLNKDVFFEIFMFLNPPELHLLYITCKFIFKLIEDDFFWNKYYVLIEIDYKINLLVK